MDGQVLQTPHEELVPNELTSTNISSEKDQASVENTQVFNKETKSGQVKKALSKEAKPEAKNGFVGQNVFTNDGLFLQRFKRAKDEKDEKDEREKALKRKQELERRIKNRGKRRKDKLARVEKEDLTSGELGSAAASYLNELKQYSEKMGNI